MYIYYLYQPLSEVQVLRVGQTFSGVQDSGKSKIPVSEIPSRYELGLKYI